MNMIDNMTSPMARVTSSVDNSISGLQRLHSVEQSFGDLAKTGAVIAGVGMQITDTLMKPVEATFATKKALGELKSVGVENLNALEKASEDFSNTWAGTTKAEFIGAAYDIKSGIASLNDEAVAKYTEIAGITAKGTKATIGEMTSLFATGYGIYKGFYKNMSDIDFGQMFAAGIGHAANIYKTDGPQMAEAISGIGAAATNAKVPMEEQFAILGQLQATMSGSEAGTKYAAFIQAAAGAGQQLGLKFTDANNQLLSMPEILTKLRGKFGETMDAAEKMQLQKAFGSDEAVDLIDLLYSKTGELKDGISSIHTSMGQGITEVKGMADAINSTEPDKYEVLKQKIHNTAEEIGNQLLPTFNEYLGKGDTLLTKISGWVKGHQDLTKNIMLVILALGIFLTVAGTTVAIISSVGLVVTRTIGVFNGLWGAATKLPGMFETIYLKALYAGDGIKGAFSTISGGAKTAVTGVKNFGLSIANMAKTAAVSGATAVKNLALSTANLARQAAIAAATGLRNMVLGLASMARQAITTAATALPGMIAAVWSFTAALLANPLTWVVIGIVALIAAVILLHQHWSQVVTFLENAWNGFVNGVIAGFNWIRNLFAGMPVWLQIAIAAFLPFIGIPLLIITHWGQITGFFQNLWFGISSTFMSGINNIKATVEGAIGWFFTSGSKIMSTFENGIMSAISGPVNAVKSGLQKIRQMLPFSDAKEGPLSQLTLSGRRTMTTIAEGVDKGQDAPALAVSKAFAKINLSLQREPVKKANLKADKDQSGSSKTTTSEKKNLTIQKLIFQVDFSKIKDLPLLFKLLREIEDFTQANGGQTDETNETEDVSIINPQMA